MKVVVTGATGNVGPSTVEALGKSREIDEIVGLARREPTWGAAEDRLGSAFELHLVETEDQERRVRERLEAPGGEPSKLKDAAGAAGGWGMVVFAAAQPDTPGKLTMHAYAYEHMPGPSLVKDALHHAAERVAESWNRPHQLPLEQAPAAYSMFQKKEDGTIKVVLKPWSARPSPLKLRFPPPPRRARAAGTRRSPRGRSRTARPRWGR